MRSRLRVRSGEGLLILVYADFCYNVAKTRIKDELESLLRAKNITRLLSMI